MRSRLGVSGDGKYDLNDKHVGDLLEAAGLDWRTYAEDFPGKCFTGGSSGKYVRKHNPFMSFTNVTTNPARCAKIENTQRFFQDYAGDFADRNSNATSRYPPVNDGARCDPATW